MTQLEPNLFSHIDHEVARWGIFDHEDRVVAAVSGGPDSLLLLLWLHSRASRWGLEVRVAHFDHRLRPDSGEDAAFVRSLCEKMGLPCSVETAEVAELADRWGTGIEDAARRARYAFLARYAMENHCSKLALAHTADDQVETVIMHLIRGAGLAGLVGMQPLAPFPHRLFPEGRSLKLVRPLLTVWRSDVEEALRQLGYTPRRDPTNADPSYLRNRLRMIVIPELELMAPRVRNNILRMARTLALDSDYIAKAADGLLRMTAKVEPTWVAFELKGLKAAHPALFARMVLRAADQVAALDGHEVEEQHLSLVWHLLEEREGTRSIDLPGGVVASSDGTFLLIASKDSVPRAFSTLYDLPIMEKEVERLVVPGVTQLSQDWELAAELIDRQDVKKWSSARVAHLDFDLLSDLVVRRRREGDRFQPLGMDVPKRLQDFLVDEKIPMLLRDRLPLVVSGDTIAWVCGVRISDRFKVTETTRRVLRLEVRKPASGNV